MIFLIATLLPIHMGALAISAAFVLGIFLLPGGFSPEALDEKSGAIADGFPGDLFITLAGVTFLFGIAKNNGTVDWLVHAAVRSVGGRVALIPWVFFGVTAVLTGIGAVVPAAVAIIAPIGMTFARKYDIKQLLMGLMVINGATAGGFSPLSIFGSITNDVVAGAGLDGSPLFLFLASLVFNVVLGIITFVLFGGRQLLGVRDVGEGELVAADGPDERVEGSRTRAFREGPAEQTGQKGALGVQRVSARGAGCRAGHDARHPPDPDPRRDGHPHAGGVLPAARRGLLLLPHRVAALPAEPEDHQGRGRRDRLADDPAGLRHRDLRQPAAESRAGPER